MQNRKTMDAFSLLRKIHLSKMITETTKKAIRVRLEAILAAEEKQLKYWEDHIKVKMNTTRQKQILREFNKRIQAIKIVIHTLTPFHERETTDIPTFIKKKYDTNKDRMGGHGT